LSNLSDFLIILNNKVNSNAISNSVVSETSSKFKIVLEKFNNIDGVVFFFPVKVFNEQVGTFGDAGIFRFDYGRFDYDRFGWYGGTDNHTSEVV